MAGRLYTAVFKAVAVTAQQDFFEITAASTGIVMIHGWLLSQTTELGDAAEEQLLITCNRGVGATTSGSGGTQAITAQPISDNDAAFGGTVDINNTTKLAAGSGSIEELEAHAWNVRVPYQMIYTPEMRPLIIPSARWTLELETTPADSITMNGTVWFEVI